MKKSVEKRVIRLTNKLKRLQLAEYKAKGIPRKRRLARSILRVKVRLAELGVDEQLLNNAHLENLEAVE